MATRWYCGSSLMGCGGHKFFSSLWTSFWFWSGLSEPVTIEHPSLNTLLPESDDAKHM